MDTAFDVSLRELLQRALMAYKEFFCPQQTSQLNMYPFHARWSYIIMLIIIIVLIAEMIIFSQTMRNRWLIVLLAFAFPIAINSSFIMLGKGYYYMMFYADTVIFAAALSIIERCLNRKSEKKIGYILRRGACFVAVLMIMFISFIDVRYANQAAMKGIYLQRQGTAFLTSLITRIQSAEGYSRDLPVLFVNENRIRRLRLPPPFEKVRIFPYSNNPLKRRVRKYLHRWCGYKPEYITKKDLKYPKIIRKMSSYPDEGSIVVAEGVVIVKF